MKHLLGILGVMTFTGHLLWAASVTKVDIQKKSTIKRPKIRTDEAFQTEKAKVLAKRRSLLIQDVREALRRVKDKDQNIELKHRLANLYIEEFKFQAQQGADARAYLQKAQGLFKELAQLGPQFQRHDEVLFQLAQSYLEFGQIDQAHQVFTALLAQHPNSPFKDEAYLQLADYSFDKGQFRKALEYFSKLIENPQSPLLLYAYYKSAWASYNLSQLNDSLNWFKKVIETEEVRGNSSHSLALKKEAVRDVCLPLADLKKYQEGIAFYREQGDPTHRKGLECLASLSQERGDSNESIELYQQLLQLDNHYAGNPEYSLSIIDIHRKHSKHPETLSALDDAMSVYLGESSWKEIFSSDPKVMESVRSSFESTTRKTALDIHAVGQKTKNPHLYQTARQFYQLYLKYFPLTLEASKAQFYLAEIDYKEKQFDSAATGYYAVFKNPQSGAELKLTALNYALMASSAQINQERKESGKSELTGITHKKRNQEEGDEQVPYSSTEDRFFSIGDEFLSQYPQDKKAPEVLFQMAYLRYLHHDNKLAYQSFWKLVQKYPAHTTATYAGLLLLDILNQKSDYTNMIAACKKLLSTPQLNQEKFKGEVSDILRKSELKQIAALEADKQFEIAAKAYLAYDQKYGSQDLALKEKALFNAAACFSQAGDSEKALGTREAFLKQFPQSKLRADLLLQVAKSYEAITDFAKAAHYFELFHRENPQHAQSQESLRLAGFYFWGSGQRDRAEQILWESLRKYPSSKEMISKDLLEFYDTEQLFSQKQDFLLNARAMKGVSFGDYLYFTLELADLKDATQPGKANGFWTEADTLVEKYPSALLESKKGAELMGRVLLRRVEKRIQNFDSVRLKLPQAQLEKSLALKMRMLKELEGELAKIAKLGGDSGLGALFYISKSYEALAREIQEAPVPSELTGEQLDIYRTELQKQMVLPFREKSLGFAQTCLDKAQELMLNSQWTGFCYTQASRLAPESHRWVRTYTLPPFVISFLSTQEQKAPISNSHFQSSVLFQERLKEKAYSISHEAVSLISYQPLTEKRLEDFPLSRTIAETASLDQQWKALNTLRIHNPTEAIRALKGVIRKNPDAVSFHNLLALAHLEANEYEKAKVTWLSLLARGISSPAIQNNLGVLEALKGNLTTASSFFAQAAQENHAEALINQGLIALGAHNGSAALLHFEKALEVEPLAIAEMGRGIAALQATPGEEAQDRAKALCKQFSSELWMDKQCAEFDASRTVTREETRDLQEVSEQRIRIQVAEPSALPDLE